jgi:hypothetical protein
MSSQTEAEPIFDAVLPEPELTKYEREEQAFRSLLPHLLQTHRDLYVAIHEGKVVDSGPERLPVAMRVWERVGNVPIYVALVSVDLPRAIRVRGPRIVGDWKGST